MGARVNAPAVSIIIPCYNTAAFLGEAIASALAQSFADFELLIIDDGSTDATPQIAARALADRRVSYHRQENLGLSAARNKGIELSRGDYVALLDADDIWEPEKLACQMELFQTLPDYGLVFSDFSTFDAEGVIASEKNPVLLERLTTPDFDALYCRHNFIFPSTVVMRRDVLESAGPFDTALKSVEDYDMWLRIARISRLAGVAARLVRIRQHGANMSRNVPRMLENEISVIEKYSSVVGCVRVKKRLAKIHYMSADRLIHAGQRLEAVRYFLKGLSICPLLLIDIGVVLIKFLLGGAAIERLRRYINGKDSLISKFYWNIYSRY